MNEAVVPLPDPFMLFVLWSDTAAKEEINDSNAMTLATCDADGQPSARMVLLKGVDPVGHPDRGFVFYTNLQSRKSTALGVSGLAGLLFHWKSLRRQIRMGGRVQQTDAAESDAYFASRPRLSRIGAWASDQSRPLAARATLEERLAAAERRFPHDDIPRPPHWGGYRLVPHSFEFWQDMPFRLHDRVTYHRESDGWTIGRLYP